MGGSGQAWKRSAVPGTDRRFDRAVLKSLAVFGEDTATILMTGSLAGLIVAIIGANHLRGYNGPLLGTLQQVVEITVLGMVLAIQ